MLGWKFNFCLPPRDSAFPDSRLPLAGTLHRCQGRQGCIRSAGAKIYRNDYILYALSLSPGGSGDGDVSHAIPLQLRRSRFVAIRDPAFPREEKQSPIVSSLYCAMNLVMNLALHLDLALKSNERFTIGSVARLPMQNLAAFPGRSSRQISSFDEIPRPVL